MLLFLHSPLLLALKQRWCRGKRSQPKVPDCSGIESCFLRLACHSFQDSARYVQLLRGSNDGCATLFFATRNGVEVWEEREPVATNVVAAVVTNFVPVFYTNVVQVPVTNLVSKPEALATIEATGSVINTFMPDIGSIVALALGGLYHGYRQVRNRKVNEALVQGVETARAVLTTTPQGQAADAQFVKWLMDHQKEAGVFTTVSGLVEQLTDSPAAKLTAQEIGPAAEPRALATTGPQYCVVLAQAPAQTPHATGGDSPHFRQTLG